MADRQIYIGDGVLHEEGTEQYYVGDGVYNEDLAAAAAGLEAAKITALTARRSQPYFPEYQSVPY